MASEAESEAATLVSNKGKGKARAINERTPLLASASSSSVRSTEESTPPLRRRFGLRLACIFLTTLLICLCALAIIVILAWSYSSRASDMSPEDILHKALVVQGPDRLDVLNVSFSNGIWVNVEGRIGLDAGSVVGVNPEAGDGVLDKIWKSLGRWGVRNLETVSVWTSTINITTRSDPPVFLATVDLPPLQLPLTVDPPADHTWLQHFSAPVHIKPTPKTSDLLHFAQESWKNGQVLVHTEMDTVDVRGGELASSSWKSRLHRELSDVKTAFSLKVPALPGFPHPGRNAPIPPIADLVTLRSFQLANKADQLTIQAFATIVDPAPPNFNITTPPLPFTVHLLPDSASPIPIASVQTEPFSLTHPNITLDIGGHVLPLPSDAFPVLSTFLSHYLAGRPNSISISTPLISDMTVEATFPAPNPKPQILRNVTIRDMKIKPGNTFLASGTVLAHVVLPKGMNVEIDVQRVLPDVLVFDGEVPDDVHIGTPPARPLPNPLPEGAFGHIRPDNWLNSRCVSIEPEEEAGSSYAVSAKIVDVPLEVLPGRQQEFSNFVSKIVFGQGAVAGILGTAAVGVDVRGIPTQGKGSSNGMELNGLPFRGSVKLGKGNLFHSVTSGATEKWKDIWHKFLPHLHAP
ncbi:hypothetical protein EV361DRAFT_192544 [Lentinula raphanica]|uniref:Uncharacterized protein n=1 Tax=Lentinula raphanica TaxID=153919 RepID=A0AA38PEW4_9AGAR|nr:hypothetical protein F5878DRAFT_531731 [Lentinula raphanica]KAJ3978080.1 hypothetical protein EV361DRAFT_192544 [Lentinula raphanica]